MTSVKKCVSFRDYSIESEFEEHRIHPKKPINTKKFDGKYNSMRDFTNMVTGYLVGDWDTEEDLIMMYGWDFIVDNYDGFRMFFERANDKLKNNEPYPLFYKKEYIFIDPIYKTKYGDPGPASLFQTSFYVYQLAALTIQLTKLRGDVKM